MTNLTLWDNTNHTNCLWIGHGASFLSVSKVPQCPLDEFRGAASGSCTQGPVWLFCLGPMANALTMVTVAAFHSWFSYTSGESVMCWSPFLLLCPAVFSFPPLSTSCFTKKNFLPSWTNSQQSPWDISHHFRVSWDFYFHPQDTLIILPICMGRSRLFKSCSTPTFLHSMCPC